MQKSALVVDDDKFILRVFSRILEKEGFRVETAETASEAILKLETKPFNLALIDNRLPDMDGTDLLARMPSNAANTVKIIITGHPSEEINQKALTRGADAYLIKPVKPEHLIQTIKQKLTKREQTMAAQEIAKQSMNHINLHFFKQQGPQL